MSAAAFNSSICSVLFWRSIIESFAYLIGIHGSVL